MRMVTKSDHHPGFNNCLYFRIRIEILQNIEVFVGKECVICGDEMQIVSTETREK